MMAHIDSNGNSYFEGKKNPNPTNRGKRVRGKKRTVKKGVDKIRRGRERKAFARSSEEEMQQGS